MKPTAPRPDCPYDELHIYELAGLIEPAEPDPAAGFLGCWLEAGSAFLFFDRPNEAEARRLAGNVAVRERYAMSYFDWQGRQAVAPFRVGPLLIRPPWASARAGEGPEILLDPGLVFGAGNHPTTRDCLAALVELNRRGRLPASALDLGCGSGILSLAAAGLGVERVTAVDLNPLCVQTSRYNVELNGLAGRIEVLRADALGLARRPAGLVLANLEAGLIEALAGAGCFQDREAIILSGLTRSHAGRVEDLVIAAGLNLERRWIADSTWFTLLLSG